MNYIIDLGSNIDRGFFSYIYTTFSKIYTCDLQNDKFYIDWSSSINYRSHLYENPFNFFFKQPFFEQRPNDATSIDGFGLGLFSEVSEEDRDKWNLILNRFLILKDDIKLEIESYYRQNFEGKKILCVHKRGSDHFYHKPIQPNLEYFSAIDAELKLNEYDKIFLATDEESSVDEFKEKYGSKLLVLDNIRTNNEKSIFKMNIDKFQHTKEVIMDAFLLSMGNKLIKTKSTISTIVCYLNKELEYISIDSHIPFKS